MIFLLAKTFTSQDRFGDRSTAGSFAIFARCMTAYTDLNKLSGIFLMSPFMLFKFLFFSKLQPNH